MKPLRPFESARRQKSPDRNQLQSVVYDESTGPVARNPQMRISGGQTRDTVKVPALVMLYHPDLRRVGERVFLTGLATGIPAEICRHSPAFVTADGLPTTTLDHQGISRSPLILLPDGENGLHIEADVTRMNYTVNGQPGTGNEHIVAEQIERGVLISLGDLALLLLNRMEMNRKRQPAHGMIGTSDALENTREEISQVALLDVPVLIRGETGCGKERVARAIHAASARRDKPFVAVNMAAIAPSAAASELFGHKRGAFTDAIATHEGFFGAADGGTLFLDEIGETPAAVQTLLLRALDEGQVQPVGGTARKVDVRLLCATDADLEQAVIEGNFREALLHRIQVCSIDVPPLRHRRDSIATLLLHFLREQLQVIGASDRLNPTARAADAWLPLSVVAELVAYDWAGNVRQLLNVAMEMAIRGVHAPTVTIPSSLHRARKLRKRPISGDFVSERRASAEHRRRAGDDPMLTGPQPKVTGFAPVRILPKDVSDSDILLVLEQNAWNLTATARSLGMAKNTLTGRMRGIEGLRRAAELTLEEIQHARQEAGGDAAKTAALLHVSARALLVRLHELRSSAGQ